MLTWLFVLLYLKLADDSGPLEFDHENAAQWFLDYPLCGGPRQSPIDLTVDKLGVTVAPTVQFAKGLDHCEVQALNTGKDIKILLRPQDSTESLIHISGSVPPFSGEWDFVDVHLHWGDGVIPHGSEHSIQGRFSDAEAHFVFYNQVYESVQEALRKPDGLLVVGILLRGTDQTRPVMFPSLGLRNQLANIGKPGQAMKIEADLTPLVEVLQQAVSKFYNYAGSLTTPPCNPVVTWVVSTAEAGIDNAFLTELTSSLFKDAAMTKPLVRNFRPLQDRGGRAVKKVYSLG